MRKYSQTNRTKSSVITIRYPITAPGNPVKMTSSVGTNSEKPSVMT